eukprot:3712737-Rhodomonas_salina.1
MPLSLGASDVSALDSASRRACRYAYLSTGHRSLVAAEHISEPKEGPLGEHCDSAGQASPCLSARRTSDHDASGDGAGLDSGSDSEVWRSSWGPA